MKVSIWTALLCAASCAASVLGGSWILKGELSDVKASVQVLEVRMQHLATSERVSALESRVTELERRLNRRVSLQGGE